jgi:hypothetical protein
VSEDATLRKPTTGIPGCCARAAIGQAAESFDEIAPPHSITSLARAMSVGGTSNLPCR